MIVLELEQVEVDYCLGCKGLWLDAGELELLIEKAGGSTDSLTEIVSAGGQVPKSDIRKCPKCASKMTQPTVPAGGDRNVTIDICPKEHGIWLDNGELRDLIAGAGGSATGRAIAEFCGDLLKGDSEKPQSNKNGS